MKLLLLSTFCLVTCNAFCQTFHPIVTLLNEWVVDFIPPNGFPQEIRRYTFSTDSTLLQGKYYYELLYSKNMNTGPWISENLFLREENGRTYKWLEDMPERLIYDFNLGIGDSLPGTDANQATRYVSQVGSIPLLDGVPKKLIEFTSVCGASRWVEGIAEMEDLLYSEVFCSLWDGVPLNIRCFSTNGQLLYKRPELSGCYTSAVSDLGIGSIQVFPNPGTDQLYLEIAEEEKISKVFIYNTLGTMVLNTYNFPSGNNALDISKLPPGLYTGMVHFEAGAIKAFRVLIAD